MNQSSLINALLIGVLVYLPSGCANITRWRWIAKRSKRR